MASWTWAKPTGGCGMGELFHVMHGSRSTFVEMVFVQQRRTTFAFELARLDRINILVMVARDVHVIETATWKVIADNLASSARIARIMSCPREAHATWLACRSVSAQFRHAVHWIWFQVCRFFAEKRIRR